MTQAEELYQKFHELKTDYTFTGFTLITEYLSDLVSNIDKHKCTTKTVISEFFAWGTVCFGPMLPVVLERCNIRSWEDIGKIMMIGVQLGLFSLGENDKLDDFLEEDKRTPLFLKEIEYCVSRNYYTVLEAVLNDRNLSSKEK